VQEVNFDCLINQTHVDTELSAAVFFLDLHTCKLSLGQDMIWMSGQ